MCIPGKALKQNILLYPLSIQMCFLNLNQYVNQPEAPSSMAGQFIPVCSCYSTIVKWEPLS